MAYYPALVTEALSKVIHPEKGKSIVELGMVEDDIRINGKRISFSLIFDRPNDPLTGTLKRMCAEAIRTHVGADVEIDGNIFVKIRQRQAPAGPRPLPGIRHTIAVASGKGGVGKSTVTANLAVALAQAGYRVGLLDADIFGPSVPIMLGTADARPGLSPRSSEGHDMVEPVERYGVRMLSIGYFVNAEDAVVWRGAMATNALRQLLTEADWGELDYLLIDMPPGTSDIHISLVGLVKLSGAVVVSTPQKVALADAIKGISMFRNPKVDVPIIGLVENMAWFTPAELPQNRYYIFGQGGTRALAQKMNLPLLAEVPIVQSIREDGDQGTPAALDADSLTGRIFADLAARVVEQTEQANR